MTDYAALIKEARISGHLVADTIPLTMTPGLFGRLLVAAWASRNGRSELPSRERLTAALFEMADTAPDDIRSVMHVERRLTGDVIAEYDEYMAYAVMDGLAIRCGHGRIAVEMDRFTADQILDGIIRGRSDWQEWIESVFDRLRSASGDLKS